jgi:hypothetical protein
VLLCNCGFLAIIILKIFFFVACFGVAADKLLDILESMSCDLNIFLAVGPSALERRGMMQHVWVSAAERVC